MLGTAQLGLVYGIANRSGRPDRAAAHALLARAYAEGVRTLDTAQAYGDSEDVIGDFLTRSPDAAFRVVSKLAPEAATADAAAVREAVLMSRDRLAGRLSVMMVHDPAALDQWHDGLGAALMGCVEDGLMEAAGVSVYTAEQFARALVLADISVIQAPFNVFDRTLAERGLVDEARRLGKEVHLRSVFLQGLLVLDDREVAERAPFARAAMASWRSVCSACGRRAPELALRFALDAAPEACIVVGCETVEQLADTLAHARAPALEADEMAAVRALPAGEERLIRPYLWQ